MVKSPGRRPALYPFVLLSLSLLVSGCGGGAAGQSGAAVYAADWRKGPDGWRRSSPGWTAHHGLASYSGEGASTFIAPYRVHGPNYALEARIRLVRWMTRQKCCLSSYFGILFRAKGPLNPVALSPPGLADGVARLSSFRSTISRASVLTLGPSPGT
ncbi:MAG: hypothetical protein JOZ41_06965, partial [Chloroflexi bacterium]|nr:hypothetical protein [Chloroflexota bacterium]